MVSSRLILALLLAVALGVGGCDDDSSTTTLPAPTPTVAPANPGGPPSFKPARTVGVALRPPAATVLVSGTTRRGEPFELVAQGNEKGTCILMLFPVDEREGGGGCGETLIDFAGSIAAWGGGTTGRGKYVAGWISPKVDRVEITYEHDGSPQALEAAAEPIPRRVLRASGEVEDRGMFVAFLPGEIELADVTATAYDAAGSELGSARWPDIDSG